MEPERLAHPAARAFPSLDRHPVALPYAITA